MKITTKSAFATDFISLCIATAILTLSIFPLLLFLAEADMIWVIFALFIWTVGNLLIFYPFIVHVYPHLMSKLSLYLLTAILIIVSSWLNITAITLLLPYDYIYYSLFNATLTQIAILGLSYVAIVTKLIMHFTFTSNINFYKEESLF